MKYIIEYGKETKSSTTTYRVFTNARDVVTFANTLPVWYVISYGTGQTIAQKDHTTPGVTYNEHIKRAKAFDGLR